METIIFYTEKAKKDLLKLEKSFAKKVVLNIEEKTKGAPLNKAKALSGAFKGLYRYRVGIYRVIFEIDSSGKVYILTVLTIKHRKDIYRSNL